MTAGMDKTATWYYVAQGPSSGPTQIASDGGFASESAAKRAAKEACRGPGWKWSVAPERTVLDAIRERHGFCRERTPGRFA